MIIYKINQKKSNKTLQNNNKNYIKFKIKLIAEIPELSK